MFNQKDINRGIGSNDMIKTFFIFKSAVTRLKPDWPILIWMLMFTLLIALLAGLNANQIISTFNSGWGYAAGEFALILLPSFIMAAAIERQATEIPKSLSVSLAPFIGAGMICPDTAYAALSPMVHNRKLSLAFGAYAGFKLLFPAGPLIVATSLGVMDTRLLAYCLLIFIPVWGGGMMYSRFIEAKLVSQTVQNSQNPSGSSTIALLPFAILAILLVTGLLVDVSFNSVLDFAVNPKGALIIAAATALLMIPRSERRDCIDRGIRQTGFLLLIIGAASAFSAFVTLVISIEQIFTPQNGFVTLIFLFVISVLFKLLQGSSMSTFAALGPIAAPIVTASEISPIAAVLAVCLGSFVAIIPNDSFYWIVRHSALSNESELKATSILGIGSLLQALIGLAVLVILYKLIL